jgi:hypothetical protein
MAATHAKNPKILTFIGYPSPHMILVESWINQRLSAKAGLSLTDLSVDLPYNRHGQPGSTN